MHASHRKSFVGRYFLGWVQLGPTQKIGPQNFFCGLHASALGYTPGCGFFGFYNEKNKIKISPNHSELPEMARNAKKCQILEGGVGLWIY